MAAAFLTHTVKRAAVRRIPFCGAKGYPITLANSHEAKAIGITRFLVILHTPVMNHLSYIGFTKQISKIAEYTNFANCHAFINAVCWTYI